MPTHKKSKLKLRNLPARFHASITQVNTVKLFYLSVVLLLFAIASLVSAYIVQQNTSKPSNSSVPFSGYSLNTPVTMGVTTMEVTKVSFSDGQPGFTAPADHHYAIVELTIKNNADHPIDVLPTSDTYVKDQTGKLSYLTPFVVDEPFRAGSLLPGEQVKGQLSYMTTKTGPLKLFIDSIWSGGVVSFKIQ
jgi:uncharacterized protein with FMN-binding domain